MPPSLPARLARLEAEALRPVVVHGMILTTGADISGFTTWWAPTIAPRQLAALRAWLTRPRPAHMVMFEQPAGEVRDGYEVIPVTDVHPDALQMLRDRLAQYRAGHLGVFWNVML